MTCTRINIIGIDSNDVRWFWNAEHLSWMIRPDLATNFESKLIAAGQFGAVSMWQRNQDPDDRMEVIDIVEVS